MTWRLILFGVLLPAQAYCKQNKSIGQGLRMKNHGAL